MEAEADKMKKIEFTVEKGAEKMLEEIHEKTLKEFPKSTIHDTARILMINAMLTHGTDVLGKILSQFSEKFAKEALKTAAANPEIIKAVKDAFKNSAESDAKKWLEDKNKK